LDTVGRFALLVALTVALGAAESGGLAPSALAVALAMALLLAAGAADAGATLADAGLGLAAPDFTSLAAEPVGTRERSANAATSALTVSAAAARLNQSAVLLRGDAPDAVLWRSKPVPGAVLAIIVSALAPAPIRTTEPVESGPNGAPG
jgi:hypothetical protein